MNTAIATYLEPAEVLEIESAGRITARLRSGARVSARLALSVPYRPTIGDELLIIGNDPDDLYVIGVLRGSGLSRFTVPGDLTIEAPHGAIRLSAAEEVTIRSRKRVEAAAPRVTLRAERLDLLAKQTIQKFMNAYTWVTELLQQKAGRLRSVTDEGYFVKAGRAHIRTKDNCVINAKTIHLG